jgi:hypothetical protein
LLVSFRCGVLKWVVVFLWGGIWSGGREREGRDLRVCGRCVFNRGRWGFSDSDLEVKEVKQNCKVMDGE